MIIESLAPSFVKSDANPNGVDEAAVAGVQQAILDDRFAWLTGLLGDFLNLDDYLGKRVSEETVRDAWNAGAEASPFATWACVPGWLDDFAEDIKRIDVPTLILHGTADRVLAIDGHGRRLHAALPEAHYVEIEGGPHVMCVSHAAEVNRELLAFLRETDSRPPRAEAQGRSAMAVQSRIVLEPSAQGIVDATSKPPFLYELEPPRARKVLEDLQAAPVDKLPVDEEWVTVPAAVGDVRVRIVRPRRRGRGAAGRRLHARRRVDPRQRRHPRPARPRARGRGARGVAVRRVPQLSRGSLPGGDRAGIRRPPNGSSAKVRPGASTRRAWRSPVSPWAATWRRQSPSWPSSEAT